MRVHAARAQEWRGDTPRKLSRVFTADKPEPVPSMHPHPCPSPIRERVPETTPCAAANLLFTPGPIRRSRPFRSRLAELLDPPSAIGIVPHHHIRPGDRLLIFRVERVHDGAGHSRADHHRQEGRAEAAAVGRPKEKLEAPQVVLTFSSSRSGAADGSADGPHH